MFASHAGTCWIELRKPDEARAMLQLLWNATTDQARRRVYGAVQLSRAELLNGDVEQAASYATTAVESVAGLTSQRSRNHLVQLRKQLAPYHHVAAVEEFERRVDLLLEG
ncbi:hypothetical protein AWW66_18750 [Micromonospora rosaria]|uniref:Bacterial transcriptional activator domain-containing protein n=2 Tax=Micromonospora rosaria TaxID=47874 RepID=A0A136PPX4_9ACTN|nr:hypothetical protein AWW66_18750 [Micromonospora rosaria]